MNPWAAIKTVALVKDVIDLGKYIYSSFFDEEEEKPKPAAKPEEPKVRKPRKKSDTTRFTQHQYDFVMRARAEWEHYNIHNPQNHKNLQVLTDVLNTNLGLNKSTRAYSRIWNGDLKREDLATGVAILPRGV